MESGLGQRQTRHDEDGKPGTEAAHYVGGAEREHGGGQRLEAEASIPGTEDPTCDRIHVMNAKRTRSWAALLPSLLVGLGWTGTLAGQAQYERPPEAEGPYERPAEAVEAIRELKSPYCPGLMLEVCPSPGGAALRDSIEALADSGWASDEIVDWVIGNHGERYRALPPRRGAGLLAWLMPPAGVLLGLVILFLAFRRMRWRKDRDSPSVEAGDVTPEEEERLQDALQRLEKEEEAPFL